MHTALLRVRESFWFLPAVLGLGSIVLAELLVLLDQALIARGATQIVFLDALSASGGRSILTTVGTSMLTIAGTSFSITISVLATTSSTYGPRLVRNFMADRANQFVLASFTSTFLYSIVVLRSVHTAVDDGDAFVPVIAIHVAVLLGLFDVGVLVFFIHHIASSTQITSLQAQVQADLERAVEYAYRSPETADPDVTVAVQQLPDRAWVLGVAPTDGYVQSVQWKRLVSWADDEDAIIDMLVMPGAHVLRGDAVFRVGVQREAGAASEVDVTERASTLARAALALGSARTPVQDVDFALQQLVEIAVRGLASGTNDPYTAVSALDLSGTALIPLWADKAPLTGYRGSDGTVRVLPHWTEPAALVDAVFDGVLTYGTDHPIVINAALRLADRLDDVAASSRRGTLATTIDRLRAARP